jgi:hypothetical protein
VINQISPGIFLDPCKYLPFKSNTASRDYVTV